MHVMWICGARRLGGAETATLELMRRLRDRAHAITVVCHGNSPVARAARDSGLPVQPAPIGQELDPRAWRAVGAALRNGRPDVAVVSTVTEWMPACLARRPPSTALVLVRHMALPLSRRVRWIAQRRADAIVAVSHAVREILCRNGLPPADQVPVLYNPIRFTVATSPGNDSTRSAARARLGIAAAGRWIAFCGGLDAKKGVLDVAAAIFAMKARIPDARLLICGPRHDAVVGEMVLNEPYVTYIGEVDRMDAVYEAADVVVMATHRELNEALPATLLEAMARGTPVVGYATGGMAEVIGTDGKTGRLARANHIGDLCRVITEVLRDRDAATQMASRALTRVQTVFDSNRIVEEYEALFTQLVAAKH